MAGRARRAGPQPAYQHDEQKQPALEERASGLLDLPGALLSLIWKLLEVADRKSLCCTVHALRACKGVCQLLRWCLPGA